MEKRTYASLTLWERRVYDLIKGRFNRPSYSTGGTIPFGEAVEFAAYIAPTIEAAAEEWIRAYDGRKNRKAVDDWNDPTICNHEHLDWSGSSEYGPAECLDCGMLL